MNTTDYAAAEWRRSAAILQPGLAAAGWQTLLSGGSGWLAANRRRAMAARTGRDGAADEIADITSGGAGAA